MKKTYDVSGMSCSACSAAIERAVGKLDGVSRCEVNLLANKMTVDYDETTLNSDTIISAVDHAGYHAWEHDASPAASPCSAGRAGSS